MNRNTMISANSTQKTKLILSAGLHPEGGFVALPGGRSARISYDPIKTSFIRINRKGFVAWPEKQAS
ncbi:MAG: hypothetical protein EOO14_16950 [Chitinophagaceae bacterium]|nr:MAG: hypothetical protein EOO14_16950 [Chitinophagaceae bacterium]